MIYNLDPSRTIPLATFISMSIVTVAYILMASALTLMVPFWEVISIILIFFFFFLNLHKFGRKQMFHSSEVGNLL